VASFIETKKADLVVCPVALTPKKGFWGRFCELEFLSLQGITAGSILINNGVMCNGANLAFKKQTWLDNQKNLHPEIASGDDVFLLHSIKKEKKLTATWLESRKALVTTKSESSVNKFIKQRSRWISKASAYNDRSTIALGIATFIAVLFQATTLVAALFNYTFIYMYIAVTLLKTIPDYLILNNTTKRYGRQSLMIWFLPSQIIYPFYVLIIAINWLACKN